MQNGLLPYQAAARLIADLEGKSKVGKGATLVLGIVPSKTVEDDCPRIRSDRYVCFTTHICAGEEHERVGRVSEETAGGDGYVDTLPRAGETSIVDDCDRLRRNMCATTGPNAYREAEIIAAVEAARGRLQIERRQIGALAVEVEGPRDMEWIRHELSRENRATAAGSEHEFGASRTAGLNFKRSAQGVKRTA